MRFEPLDERCGVETREKNDLVTAVVSGAPWGLPSLHWPTTQRSPHACRVSHQVCRLLVDTEDGDTKGSETGPRLVVFFLEGNSGVLSSRERGQRTSSLPVPTSNKGSVAFYMQICVKFRTFIMYPGPPRPTV